MTTATKNKTIPEPLKELGTLIAVEVTREYLEEVEQLIIKEKQHGEEENSK